MFAERRPGIYKRKRNTMRRIIIAAAALLSGCAVQLGPTTDDLYHSQGARPGYVDMDRGYLRMRAQSARWRAFDDDFYYWNFYPGPMGAWPATPWPLSPSAAPWAWGGPAWTPWPGHWQSWTWSPGWPAWSWAQYRPAYDPYVLRTPRQPAPTRPSTPRQVGLGAPRPSVGYSPVGTSGTTRLFPTGQQARPPAMQTPAGGVNRQTPAGSAPVRKFGGQ